VLRDGGLPVTEADNVLPARRRTVEGDLGVSSSVDDLRAAARAEGLAPGDDPLQLGRRPRWWHYAGTCGPRRPTGRAARARGESGSSSSPAGPSGTSAPASSPGWPPTAACSVLTGTQVVVDHRYVLAAAGLLAGEHPGAAAGLLRELAG
jgi:hypothetical protein